MDGNNKAQFEHLRQKAEEFKSNASPVKVSRFQAKLGLDTTIMKTLEYPMEAIDLERKEWDKVMQPILNCILPKLGINRKFPRKLVYAPEKFSGLGIQHPYFTQHFRQLGAILQEAQREGITSNIIKANFEQARLECGINGPAAEWPHKIVDSCMSKSWLKSLLNFCHDNGIGINDTTPLRPDQATQDTNLMRSFWEHGADKTELSKLNMCRMFLKVISVSDITSIDGKEILAWA